MMGPSLLHLDVRVSTDVHPSSPSVRGSRKVFSFHYALTVFRLILNVYFSQSI